LSIAAVVNTFFLRVNGQTTPSFSYCAVASFAIDVDMMLICRVPDHKKSIVQAERKYQQAHVYEFCHA
jgi:hypothetical protein